MQSKNGSNNLDILSAETDEDSDKVDENYGEAAKYGIFYDDSEYDYMQHLRKVGMHPDAVLMAAKKEAAFCENSDKFARNLVETDGQSLDAEDLRQVLEALEDEAYENELDENFIRAMAQVEIERNDPADPADFANQISDVESKEILNVGPESSLMDSFGVGNKNKNFNEENSGLFNEESKENEQFDEILKEYQDEEGDENANEPRNDKALREDEAILSKLLLESTETGLQQVAFCRKILVDEQEKQKILEKYGMEAVFEHFDCNEEKSIPRPLKVDYKAKIDCNSAAKRLESTAGLNKPIEIKPQTKILINPKTGFPKVLSSQEETENEASVQPAKLNLGAARNKLETAEEKRLRKQQLKMQKEIRREEKKQLTQLYREEYQRQIKQMSDRKLATCQIKL